MIPISLPHSAASLLAQSAQSLFGSLGEPALAALESALSVIKLEGGETLFEAGDPGDALYVVVFGRLRAVIRDTPEDWVLGEIGRGESVGEMALLSGDPRSATVYAVRDTEVIRLHKSGFESLIERHPAVMLELTRLIIARYQRAIESRAESQPVALAILPCCAGVQADALAAGLCRALEPGRNVLHLDPNRLRTEHAIPAEWLDDPTDSQLAGWLHHQESRCDYVIYVADAKQSPWTRLCVRQADLLLFVGNGNGEPDRRILNDLEAGGRVAARRELVLLYDSSRAPTGTAAWLTGLPVSAHHHVDLRRSSDVERLARLVTGTAVGLVLGGGGARGLAHIGVLRALEEAGIPIDLIGGTSIGAVIAAQHAMGWDSARVFAETERAFAKRSLNDFTIPLIALLHGKRYIRALEQLFGDWCIEDLPLWYFCVSTNLTRSEMVVHRAGRMRKWVAASIAVPGLGPPIFDGRDVLVDGGVLNNLPVDVMRHFRRGRVIASNASPRVAMRLDREHEDIPSPWRVLASRFNPFGMPIRIPTIVNILTRSASLPRVTHETGPEFRPDLLIEPPVEGFRLLDWRAIATLVDIGYRSAVAALERWDRNPKTY